MKIFISHSSEDKPLIREVLQKIPQNIHVWLDEFEISTGRILSRELEEAIHISDHILLFFSLHSIESEWFTKEVLLAIDTQEKFRKLDRSQAEALIIPIALHPHGEILKKISSRKGDAWEKIADWLKECTFLKLKGRGKEDVDQLAKKIKFEIYRSPHRGSEHGLAYEIGGKDLWGKLLDICVHGAINGGVRAMAYYRKTKPISTSNPLTHKNPTTLADIEATMAILRSLDPPLEEITANLACNLFYLGEETVDSLIIEERMKHHLHGIILEKNRFFTEAPNAIRVIIDAIDGTSNFMRGFPLFCSGVALFIENELRIGVVYDPIHHVVYSGLLQGHSNKPEDVSDAWQWDIQSNQKIDLKAALSTPKEFEPKSAIGIHLTRSSPPYLEYYFKHRKKAQCLIEALAKKMGGVYALNSGIFAMTEVARGALQGFVNSITNPWDVAAGEVIIRACGGIVTDFNGDQINYQKPGKVSVIAGVQNTHEQLLNLIKQYKPYYPKN